MEAIKRSFVRELESAQADRAAQSDEKSKDSLADTADTWEDLLPDACDGHESTKLIIPLSDTYADRRLTLDVLTGADAALVARLRSSGRFGVALASVTKVESGLCDGGRGHDPYANDGEASDHTASDGAGKQSCEPAPARARDEAVVRGAVRDAVRKERDEDAGNLGAALYKLLADVGLESPFHAKRVSAACRVAWNSDVERVAARAYRLLSECDGHARAVASGARKRIVELHERWQYIMSWHVDPALPATLHVPRPPLDACADSVTLSSLFRHVPDHEEYQRKLGHCVARHFYRLNGLVVWPRAAAFRLQCEADLLSALCRLSDELTAAGDRELVRQRLRVAYEHLKGQERADYDAAAALLRLAWDVRDIDMFFSTAELVICGADEEQGVVLFPSARSDIHEKSEPVSGVASEVAVSLQCDVLSELGNACRSDSTSTDNEFEKVAIRLVTSTPSPALPYLAALAARLGESVSEVPPRASDLLERVIAAAADTASKRVTLQTAMCHAQVVQLAVRADDTVQRRMMDEIASFRAGKWEERYIPGWSSDLTELAERSLRAGGPLCWALHRHFVTYVLPRGAGKPRLQQIAEDMWLRLLRYIANVTDPPCGEDVREATAVAEQMVKACNTCEGEELLRRLGKKDVRRRFERGGAAVPPVLISAVRAYAAVLGGVPVPQHRWALPRASVSGDERVTDFLHGPERRFMRIGYKGLGHAREVGERMFDNLAPHRGHVLWEVSERRAQTTAGGGGNPFFVMSRAGGRGKTAFVEVVKMDDKIVEYGLVQQQLCELRSWLANFS